MNTLPLLRCCALLAVAGHQVAAAPLTIEALLDYEGISALELSDDGRSLAIQIIASNPAYRDDANLDVRGAALSRLEIREVESGDSLPGLPVGVETSNASWSPDGSMLAFQTGLDDAARLWVWTKSTGQARQITDAVPRRLNARQVWTPDSRSVLVAVLPEGVTNDDIRRKLGRTESDDDYPLDKKTPGARVALYRAGSQDLAPEARQDYSHNQIRIGDLALIDVASGHTRRAVTGHRPVNYSVSPDGKRLAFVESVGQQQGSGYRNLYDLWVMEIGGAAPHRLVQDIAQIGIYMDASWSPDGRWLTYADSGPAGKQQVYFVEVASGGIRAVSLPDKNVRLVPPLWDRAGANVFLITSKGLTKVPRDSGEPALLASEVVGYELLELIAGTPNGEAATTPAGELVLRGRGTDMGDAILALDAASDRTRILHGGAFALGARMTRQSGESRSIAYVRQSAGECPQAWVSDIAFSRPRRITQMNPQFAKVAMGSSRLVEWRGLEGELMHGALLMPPDYQPGQSVPLVVYLYGDDRLSRDLHLFGFNDQLLMPYENMQLLASRGYAVLRPDTRTREHTPMSDIAASIMPAIDRLVDMGIADPARLGIMGRSYGGYSVMAVLVQTQRFKAAIEVCGQANLFGVYREMDSRGNTWKISWVEEHQGKLRATPWAARDRYVENSPFFYLDRVTTPLLIVHGTKDTAVAIEAGDELFLSLRRLGKQVEYAKYLGESHVITERANVVDYANRMIEWFERHMPADNRSGGKQSGHRN